MTRRTSLSLLCLLLVLLAPFDSSRALGRASPASLLHLRRATFDPLQQTPTLANNLRGDAATRLRLMQFDVPPTAHTLAQLRAAGILPLAYVPDQALVVRVADGARTVAGVRWSGPFAAGYKLAAELDSALGTASTLDLQILATADTDGSALAAAIGAAGGAVQRGSASPSGTTLRAQLSGAALQTMLQRDDLLWVEPFIAARAQNDKALPILGVPAVRQQLGLNGAGQIVAVTDTGLDVQSNVSADFAGRIARGFSREEMKPGCLLGSERDTWSDLNGHGTHVSGIVLGNGALSGGQYAGIAPAAQLVTQAVGDESGVLYCLPSDDSFLQKAYDAGARVQNASWGGPTSFSGANQYGAYTTLSTQIDTFVWQHPEHLFVTVTGNEGRDTNGDGVVDADTIDQPGTAKNVITVGASENNRPPTGSCANDKAAPQNLCWGASPFVGPKGAPFTNDFVSDNPNGIAAFSGRGPTDDGRIKPELVAPGTNVLSSRSHDPGALYDYPLNDDYAYEFGTSFSAPMISGLAALVRQWLAQSRGANTPSAALVKALLLNGATNIAPGQYGTGAQREIPAAWPNNVEGWGRASITATVGLGRAPVWFEDNQQGIEADAVLTYTINVSTSTPLRTTLVWTDPPATPAAQKALVNDLDLELRAPDGSIVRGNASATLPADCRDAATSADRCNNAEAIEVAAPQLGIYTAYVRAYAVNALWSARQPFALVASTSALGTPTLNPVSYYNGPNPTLTWSSVNSATRYELQQRPFTDTVALSATYALTGTALTLRVPVGRYVFAVRACDVSACGAWSAPLAIIIRDRWIVILPFVRRDAELQ